MTIFRRCALRGALLVGCGALPLLADFTYDETSQITGGAMIQLVHFAGAFSKDSRKLTEPRQTTTSIKGNRMVRKSADQATIIDLDQQTFTTIRFADKSYSVMTFAELKQKMAEMAEKMQSRKGQNGSEQANLSFNVSVKDTGQTKTINGNTTQERIMTLTTTSTDKTNGAQGAMNVVVDSWIAPDVAGYSEVRDFNKRLAETLGSVPGENPLVSRPDMAKAMAEVYKESSKLNGMPLATTTKMGASVEGGSDGSGQAASSSGNAQHSETAQQQPSVGGALAGALGGFGLGRHKKRQDDTAASDSGSSAQGGTSKDSSGSLLEMSANVTSYNSNAVDAAVFEVPAGFTKVEGDLTGRKHR
jgi:hypothetical protein